jgi:hypothetical protein
LREPVRADPAEPHELVRAVRDPDDGGSAD